MLFIDNQNITDPRINLAIEEYCVKHLDPEQTCLFRVEMLHAIFLDREVDPRVGYVLIVDK